MIYRQIYDQAKRMEYRWYVPVVIFMWAAGCIAGAIQTLMAGEFLSRLTDQSPQVLIRPDTHPFIYWGCISGIFLVGIGSAVIGIFSLRMFLRQRHAQKK
jgi:hypothetical protein